MENDFVKILDEHPDLTPAVAVLLCFEMFRRVFEAFTKPQGGLDK